MIRPRIAISACLLGHRVRYDGGHKTDRWIVDTLGPRVDWIPICPEFEAGMGVPREPIDLVREAPDAAPHAIGSQSGSDFAPTLRAATHRLLEQIARADAHILKAQSPSCGWVDAAVEPGSAGDGIYAASLRTRFPQLPVVTEVGLMDAEIRGHFLEQVRTRLLARIAASGQEPGDLPENWAE